MKPLLTTVMLNLACAVSSATADIDAVHKITVDCSKEIGKYNHVWRMTHVVPGSRLLDADVEQEMEYLGGLPHGVFIYVRPHSLLDLVTVEGFGTGNPRYDWSKLDIAMDSLVNNHLKPFFEFMGCPEGVPTISKTHGPESFTAEVWKRLAHDVAAHCVERYGRG